MTIRSEVGGMEIEAASAKLLRTPLPRGTAPRTMATSDRQPGA